MNFSFWALPAGHRLTQSILRRSNFRRALPSAAGNTPLDGSKGTPLSFRAWDGQLRQTLLLTDGQGVVAQAPIEGLLHPSNVLDTLGVDAPERACKATR